MIAAERVAVILLAAGLSQRFGPSDKLKEKIGDLALGLHAARTLGSLPFAAKLAVVRAGGPDFTTFGFSPVLNDAPELGQARSIRLGVAAARLCDPAAVLIALADMPFITVEHVTALLARFDRDQPVVASNDGDHACPPTLVGAAEFHALAACEGDQGARHLLRHAALVPASSRELADVDVPADLPKREALQQR